MSLDWSEIAKKYKGSWIALKEDEQTVIASGSTAKEVLEKARNKGYPKPILTRIPEAVITYVG